MCQRSLSHQIYKLEHKPRPGSLQGNNQSSYHQTLSCRKFELLAWNTINYTCMKIDWGTLGRCDYKNCSVSVDFIVSQYWLELVVNTLIEGNQRAEWTGCCKRKHGVPIGPAEKWTSPLFLIGQMLLSCSLGGNWKRHADSSPWGINRNQISEVKLKLVILFPLHKNRKWMVVGAKTHFLIHQRLQIVLVRYFHYSN